MSVRRALAEGQEGEAAEAVIIGRGSRSSFLGWLPDTDGREVLKEARRGFWLAARRAYPAGLNLLRLRRPAFSPDGERAVVYYGWGCGGRCGETRLALVSRASGHWAVIHDHPMMIY